ncbi:MAG: glycosyltransferase family 39 protein [Bryobacteraceae bacterium]
MRRVALFLLLLLPTAYFAWRHADMPQFGRWIHDDSVYFVSAKSIAEGHGYRILSYPDTPFQTKYPPLFPLVLAGVWKLNPHFPDNLVLGTLVSWLWVPVLLWLCLRLFLAYGFSEKQAWAMTALFAVNPYLAIFGSSMLSELPFTCLLILCLLFCIRAAQERAPVRWAVLAGVTGGLSFLTRTTGLMLLVSGVVCFLWRKQRKQALWFAATMLPFVAGWTIWTRLHMVHGADPVTLYYTTYLDYHLYLVKLADLPMILWKNVDQWLLGVGALIIPEASDARIVKIVTQTVGVAILAGVVRLVRSGRALDYAMFAVPFSIMLVAWHYPPTERLVAPVYPLLLAGFWRELRHIASMLGVALHHRDKSQRVAAGATGLMLVGVLAAGAWMQYNVGWRILPREMNERRKEWAADEIAFKWMCTHLPHDAQVLTYNDPILFLYTGHRAASLEVVSMFWYRGNLDVVLDTYAHVADFAGVQRLGYAYFTHTDFRRHMGDADRKRVIELIEHNPDLEVTQRFASATLYRVRPHREMAAP